jgi:hypothetical protein
MTSTSDKMITPIIGLITTTSKNTDKGIQFYENDSNIYILEVYPTSPFVSTELRSGMLVVSVNDIPCDKLGVDFATKLVFESTGILKILAHHDPNTMTPLSEIPVAIASAVLAPPQSDIPVAATPSLPDSSTSISVAFPLPSDIPVATSLSQSFALASSTTVSQMNSIFQGTMVTEEEVRSRADQQRAQTIAPASSTTVSQMNSIFKGTMVTEEEVRSIREQRRAQTRPPPPGLASGGVWGEMNDVGCKSLALATVGCLFVGPLWCLILCCAIDKKKGYCINGIIYNKRGKYLAEEKCAKFKPFTTNAKSKIRN